MLHNHCFWNLNSNVNRCTYFYIYKNLFKTGAHMFPLKGISVGEKKQFFHKWQWNNTHLFRCLCLWNATSVNEVVQQAPCSNEVEGVHYLHELRHTGLLCVQACFLHSQETASLKTDFPWQLIWGKAQLKRLSAAAAWTQRRKKEWWERAALKLIPLILWGVGVFPSLVSLFMTTYFFSLLLIFFSSFSASEAHVSLQSSVWFSKCQHTGA